MYIRFYYIISTCIILQYIYFIYVQYIYMDRHTYVYDNMGIQIVELYFSSQKMFTKFYLIYNLKN